MRRVRFAARRFSGLRRSSARDAFSSSTRAAFAALQPRASLPPAQGCRIRRMAQRKGTTPRRLVGYLRHPATHKWLHPLYGAGIMGGRVVLHRDPPDPHLLAWHDDDTLMHLDSGLFLHTERNETRQGTFLSFRPSCVEQPPLKLRLEEDGRLRLALPTTDGTAYVMP
mmetsp:Transcript_10767/g.22694  ORF Transcript_10767/g.22694 Transcript_10767/m.22694 type:complete len:168 (-) Transcript_10767:6-509(-)